MTKKVYGIIPARYASSRFPGKPLHLIAGKSLIQRTYENACRCSLFTTVIVATDDERIYEHVKSFGGNVEMTSIDCLTGTDRLVDLLTKMNLGDDESIIVNIQGDAPSVEPEVFQALILELLEHPHDVFATAVMPIETEEEANNPSVVKCVIDKPGHALYFSRRLIPYYKSGRFSKDQLYYHHLGIYAFRRKFLMIYSKLPPTPLMLAEDLEQLKVLEHGYKIKVAVVKSKSFGVDTPEDAKRLEALCKQNSSLSQGGSAPL